MVPDSQVLVEKIVRLQRHIARKQEKLDFLEEHMGTMTEEVKKKNRIIVEYVMKAEAGIMSTENMDENKVSQWRWRWRIWFKRFAPFCFWCNSTSATCNSRCACPVSTFYYVFPFLPSVLHFVRDRHLHTEIGDSHFLTYATKRLYY